MSSEQQGTSGARTAPRDPYNYRKLLGRLNAADAETKCHAVQELCSILQDRQPPQALLAALLEPVRHMFSVALSTVSQSGEPQPAPAHTPATEAAMQLLLHVPHNLLGMSGLAELALKLGLATARTHGQHEAQCKAIQRILSNRASLPYDALNVVQKGLQDCSPAGAAGHNFLLRMLCRTLANVLSALPAAGQREALVVRLGKLVQVIVDSWRSLVPCDAAGVDVAPAELAQFAELRRVLGLNDEWAGASSMVAGLIHKFAVGGVEDMAREQMAQAQQECDNPSLNDEERTHLFLEKMLPTFKEFKNNVRTCALGVPALAKGVLRASAGSSADELKAASVAVGACVGIYQGLGKAASEYFEIKAGDDAKRQLLLQQCSLETEMRATIVSLAGEEVKGRYDKLQAQVDARADGSSLVAMVVDFEEHATQLAQAYMLTGDYLERMGIHVLLCAADTYAAAGELQRMLIVCLRVASLSPMTSGMRQTDLQAKLHRMAPGLARSGELDVKGIKAVFGREALGRVRAVQAEGQLSDPVKYGLSEEVLRSLEGDQAQAVDKLFAAMVAATTSQRQNLAQLLSGEPLYDAATALARFEMHIGAASMDRIPPGYAARISVVRRALGAESLEGQRELLGDLYQLVLVARPQGGENQAAYDAMMDSISERVLPMLAAQHGHLRRGGMADSEARALLDLCKGYMERIQAVMSRRTDLDDAFARLAAKLAGELLQTKAAQVEAVEEARLKLEGLQVHEAPATPDKPAGLPSLEEVLGADRPVVAQRNSESLWHAAMRKDWDPYARLVVLTRSLVPMALRKGLQLAQAPQARA